jgi:hypothetical protein
MSLQASIVNVHGPLKLLNFNFNADPDLAPAFHSNADPDPASKNNADTCGSGSTTQKKRKGKPKNNPALVNQIQHINQIQHTYPHH